MALFRPGILNAWLLSLPFFLLVTLMAGTKREVIKRMSDMAGYTTGEKIITICASLSPYPFMIATVWAPFTSSLPLIIAGSLVYIAGMALLAASLRAIIATPLDEPFAAGPYRISRNPMYVSATAVFAGISLVTANLALVVYLVITTLLQHFMILAEERSCRLKYGAQFENYAERVLRYLFIRKSS